MKPAGAEEAKRTQRVPRHAFRLRRIVAVQENGRVVPPGRRVKLTNDIEIENPDVFSTKRSIELLCDRLFGCLVLSSKLYSEEPRVTSGSGHLDVLGMADEAGWRGGGHVAHDALFRSGEA